MMKSSGYLPKFGLTMILGLLSVFCYSQQYAGGPLKSEKYLADNGERLLIPSRILRQDREIYIGLPAGFNDTTEYPLVMVLEGEILFETMAPLTRLAAQVNEIPPCIVVGIPFHNQHLEYAPVISAPTISLPGSSLPIPRSDGCRTICTRKRFLRRPPKKGSFSII
jgi:hypothetical protein